MTTVTVELPDDIFVACRLGPTEIAREMRIGLAVELYRRTVVSQGKGAEIAGLTRAGFIGALSARKVDVCQVDLESLERELEGA